MTAQKAKQNEARSGLWGEVADAFYGGLVEVLEERYKEVDSAVEIGAIDDAVMSVRISHRSNDIHRGSACPGLLDFCGVVPVPLHEVQLQRNVVGVGGVFDEADEFAVGDGAGVIQEDAGTATEVRLGLFWVAALVVGDATFKGETQVGAHEVGCCTCAAEADFFLGSGYKEDLVWVGELGKALHGFK